MSGDFNIEDEPILFYSEEMTATKLIALRHRGIKLHLYSRVFNKLVREIFNQLVVNILNI